MSNSKGMKGVLICGGTGSRLRPLTEVTHKSLLPVYDKPLIHYPLHTLLQAGIKEIMVITMPDFAGNFVQYLGSGEKWGCKFTYRIQDKPEGIAQALGMAEEFAAEGNICALLGDNIYFDDISPMVNAFKSGAHIFVKEFPDVRRFGVVEIDESGKAIDIEEKPENPKSNLAQTGCFIYDSRCFDVIKKMKPSNRGELEITDVTKWYATKSELKYTLLEDEWIDAGTFESLHHATKVVRERKKYGAECPITSS